MSRALRRNKRYPAYKESGVQWLGEIPTKWIVPRLKYLAALNPDSLPEDADPAMEIEYVDIGGVNSQGQIVSREKLSFGTAPSRARRLVAAGDVILSTVRTYLRAIAPIRERDSHIVVSTGFAVVRPQDGLVPAFAAHALRAPYFVERVVSESKGVSFPAIVESEMATFELAIPSIEEQHAIAAFLDRETAKIDALVAKKERLIELLNEKRSALITRVVTKGLDPNVPMKDSRVEWLGDIPADWNISKMWVSTQAISGGTPRDEPRFWDGGIPWVSPKDMKRRLIDSSEDTVSSEAINEGGLKLIDNPAVLIVVRGMILAHSFPVALTTAPVTINQDMKALLVRDDLDPEFFAYWLSGAGPNLRALLVEEAAHGTKAIRMDTWRVTAVEIPPEHEQRRIVAFLDSELADLDQLIDRVREAVQKLVEFRSAVISAAVTGKIDVREEMA